MQPPSYVASLQIRKMFSAHASLVLAFILLCIFRACVLEDLHTRAVSTMSWHFSAKTKNNSTHVHMVDIVRTLTSDSYNPSRYIIPGTYHVTVL